jgi:YesN/AraC family two-component response regulator
MNTRFNIEHTNRTGHFSMQSDHFHEDYEIYYLLAGERYYFIKDTIYLLKKGDIIFIDQSDLHRTVETGIDFHERILINFTNEFFSMYNPEILQGLVSIFTSENKLLRLKPPDQTFIEDLLFSMMKETNQRLDQSDLYIQSLLTQLLIYCNRSIKRRNNKITEEEANPLHKKISSIIAYINKHYMEPLQLSYVAEHFQISIYYLSRTFKQVTGFTFVEYVNSVRVKEAQLLLRETDIKIIHIANKVGFENIAHFGRVFKNFSKLSPTEYRRRFASDNK